MDLRRRRRDPDRAAAILIADEHRSRCSTLHRARTIPRSQDQSIAPADRAELAKALVPQGFPPSRAFRGAAAGGHQADLPRVLVTKFSAHAREKSAGAV